MSSHSVSGPAAAGRGAAAGSGRGAVVTLDNDPVDPVLDVWKALPARSFPNYASGTWGPKESDQLLENDGRSWKNLTD